MEEQQEKVLLTVSRMGDFHKNLAGSLKFRDPYQDDHEQSVLNSNIFQSAFRRSKSISSGNAHALGKSPQAKRARVDLVDVGEDDQFSPALLEPPSSSTQEQSFNAENENVFVNEAKVPSLDAFSAGEMLRILRNSGDSIGKRTEFLVDKSLTPSIKEVLCNEAARWKSIV